MQYLLLQQYLRNKVGVGGLFDFESNQYHIAVAVGAPLKQGSLLTH